VLVEHRPGASLARAGGMVRVPTFDDVREAIAILERA
jgi:hypothetical protein